MDSGRGGGGGGGGRGQGGLGWGIGRGALMEALRRKAMVQVAGEEPLTPPLTPPVESQGEQTQLSPSQSLQQPPTRILSPPQTPTRLIVRPPQAAQIPIRPMLTRSIPHVQMPTRSVPEHMSTGGPPIHPTVPQSAIHPASRSIPRAPEGQAAIGRAHVLESMLRKPPLSLPPQQTGIFQSGRGRAALMSRLSTRPDVQPATGPPPTEQATPVPTPAATGTSRIQISNDGEGVTGTLANLTMGTSSGSELSVQESHRGTSGKTIHVVSNYLNLKFINNKGIFRYETRFEPETDSPRVRNALLNQHLEVLGKCKIFDGVLLYISKRLPESQTCLKSVRHDGVQVSINLIFQKKQKASESVHFFNILLSKVMKCLKMVRINRNSFNPRFAHRIEQHKMELWPGYITAIEEVEGGLKLNIDASHRVLRTDTVRNFMVDLHKQSKGNFREVCVSELLGLIVITRYNNSTYRIDDIHWDKDPSYRFEWKGAMISLAEYYKCNWNIEIQDMKQPLLYHQAKKRGPNGSTIETDILLIPELCYLTGLTNAIRNNFKIMRDLAAITQVSPEKRRQVIKGFIRDIYNTPIANELLNYWGLNINDDMVQLQGRILPQEVIKFGRGNSAHMNDRADWRTPLLSNPLLRTPGLHKWFICNIERDQRVTEEFIKMLIKVAAKMHMDIADPRRATLRNDSTQSYIQEIRKIMPASPDMVVCIVPTVRNDRYAAIKKLCCVESPVRSQVIVTKTISDERKLRSVSEKIAIQMSCKMGGAPWALQIPLNNIMVVGIDVFHSGRQRPKTRSVAGFVASLDKQLTVWHSTVAIQGAQQELIDLLKVCFVSALKAYYRKTATYPDRIIIFRDGVGDGQLSHVSQYEIQQLKDAFKLTDVTSYKPLLTVVVVQKRINTRIMICKSDKLENPLPGTIVDSEITRKGWYDFFLVPQITVMGTVTPVHYVVLLDEAGLQADHLQRLAYKLCHLYYNWCGTIKVPAPCQYAHKLAHLVGQSIQAQPSPQLAETLYYL